MAKDWLHFIHSKAFSQQDNGGSYSVFVWTRTAAEGKGRSLPALSWDQISVRVLPCRLPAAASAAQGPGSRFAVALLAVARIGGRYRIRVAVARGVRRIA